MEDDSNEIWDSFLEDLDYQMQLPSFNLEGIVPYSVNFPALARGKTTCKYFDQTVRILTNCTKVCEQRLSAQSPDLALIIGIELFWQYQ